METIGKLNSNKTVDSDSCNDRTKVDAVGVIGETKAGGDQKRSNRRRKKGKKKKLERRDPWEDVQVSAEAWEIASRQGCLEEVGG